MPRDDDDLPDSPKCLICAQRREGRRYGLWGGVYISTEETRPLFSNTITVTSKYRNLRRTTYYACRPCARWAVRWAALPMVSLVLLIAAGFLTACIRVTDKEGDIKIATGTAAGLAGLLAGALVAKSLVADTDSAKHDGSLRAFATRKLKAKGKGDTYFTDREYELMFLNKRYGLGTACHKTAAEILGSDDEDDDDDDEDDRPARGRRK